MFIVLNGPLGVGKSTLAEALSESIEYCVMISGDSLLAVNPPPADELRYLHSAIALMVGYHRRAGYRHFVIEHVWRSPQELAGLRRALVAADPQAEVHCFLLTLSHDENLQRIERRRLARAIDEREFELRTFAEERDALAQQVELGEPFDVSAPPADLVARMLRRLPLT